MKMRRLKVKGERCVYKHFPNKTLKGGGLKAMSPLRLATFILSILMSIVSTSVFLWGIPCDSNTCTAQR